MTDNEIKSALEGAILSAKWYDSKVWSIEEYKLKNALDLITRQQAEIEKLEKVLNGRDQLVNALNKCYKQAKSEAVKEFVEKFKEKISPKVCCGRLSFVETEYVLKNLLKEMVGENDENDIQLLS